MERDRELAEIGRHWRPPVELTGSTPREVKMSGGGRVVAGLAIAMFAGAVAAAVGLSQVASREASDAKALKVSGVEVQAEVIRHWRPGGKDSPPRITYEFRHDGRTYHGTARTPRKIWEGLVIGSPVAVRFLPERPEVNRPAAWRTDDLPWWLPGAIALGLVLIGLALLWLIRRQMSLLAEGRAAAAVVVGHTRVKHGQALKYEFALLGGGTAMGRGGQTRNPPPVGSTICVLYDRDNPKRNAPYPFEMVRVVR